jgi:hypothetical protein
MKPVKTILIILLITATLAAATERTALWTFWGAIDPWTYDVLFNCELPPEDIRYGTAFDDGHVWHRTDELGIVNYYYEIDLEGNIISSFPGPGVLNFAWDVGIDTDADGDLWINYNEYVYHVTPTGSIIEPVPFLLWADDIAWDGSYLWAVISVMEGVIISKYNVNTGDEMDSFWVPGGTGTLHGSIAADEEYLYVSWRNDGYEWEPPSFYYILTHSGEEVHYLETGTWTWGWDIAEWAFVSIEPASLGQIKAMFR